MRTFRVAICIVMMLALLWGSTGVFAAAYRFNQVTYNPNAQVIETNTLRIRKSIQQTDVDHFDITLTADTKDDILLNMEHPGTSVVFVLDNSASMLQPFSNNLNRSQALEEAVDDFLDVFLGKSASPNNEIAVVAYESGIYTFGSFGFNTGAKNKDLAAAKEAVHVAISPLPNATTNIQLALKTARDYMKTANNQEKYVILFSDGVPNHGYNATSGQLTDRITTVNGIGFDFYVSDFGSYPPFTGYTVAGRTVNSPEVNHLIATVSEGLIAQDEGLHLYSIFAYGITTSAEERKKAEFVMLNIASHGEHFYETSNLDELMRAFEQIALTMHKRTAPWFIEDPMGYGVSFQELRSINGSDLPSGIQYLPRSNTLAWNMLNTTTPPLSILEDGYTQRYELTYSILFSSRFVIKNDLAYYPGKEYDTNQPTLMLYNVMSGGTFDRADTKQAWFHIPRVTPPRKEEDYIPDTGDSSTPELWLVLLCLSLLYLKKILTNQFKGVD